MSRSRPPSLQGSESKLSGDNNNNKNKNVNDNDNDVDMNTESIFSKVFDDDEGRVDSNDN